MPRISVLFSAPSTRISAFSRFKLKHGLDFPFNSDERELATAHRTWFAAANGEVAEWFKAAVLKTAVRESVPWVRIPPSPPFLLYSALKIKVKCKRKILHVYLYVHLCPMRYPFLYPRTKYQHVVIFSDWLTRSAPSPVLFCRLNASDGIEIDASFIRLESFKFGE